MQRPFLVGRRVYLRPLETSSPSDAHLSWLNDREVTRFLRSGRRPTSPAELQRYLDRFKHDGGDMILAIVERETDHYVGNVTLNNVDWVNRTADTGLLIGERSVWGRGYASEAWSLLLDHGFRALGLRKILATVCEPHAASLRVLTKLGFKVEGRLRGEFYLDGAHVDVLRLGVFENEFTPSGQSET